MKLGEYICSKVTEPVLAKKIRFGRFWAKMGQIGPTIGFLYFCEKSTISTIKTIKLTKFCRSDLYNVISFERLSNIFLMFFCYEVRFYDVSIFGSPLGILSTNPFTGIVKKKVEIS